MFLSPELRFGAAVILIVLSGFFTACTTVPMDRKDDPWDTLPVDQDLYLSISARAGDFFIEPFLKDRDDTDLVNDFIMNTRRVYIGARESAAGLPYFDLLAEGDYPAAGMEWFFFWNKDWQNYRGYRHRWVHLPTGIEVSFPTKESLYVSSAGNDHLYMFPDRQLPDLPRETELHFTDSPAAGYVAVPKSALLKQVPVLNRLPVESYSLMLDWEGQGEKQEIVIHMNLSLMNPTAAVITRNLLTAGLKAVSAVQDQKLFTTLTSEINGSSLYVDLQGVDYERLQAAVGAVILPLLAKNQE